MSHTPVPEKIEISEPLRSEIYKNDYIIAEKVNQLINWAHSIEKRMEDYAWPKHVTGAVEQSIIDQHVTKALAEKEQPSEVVRPDLAALDFLHGKYCVVAYYPTREAAETARKMLLGNVE